eukprot:TRINITY_DN218_c0_g4_i2.p1 TRINITY_DN218_c0_g4~~TRINITY_DN218_c0_g4_i2.p1  ORF type:complete len:627 (+),score=89.87 TRINITY_DN218_c0_g4_i2:70-1950(+)
MDRPSSLVPSASFGSFYSSFPRSSSSSVVVPSPSFGSFYSSFPRSSSSSVVVPSPSFGSFYSSFPRDHSSSSSSSCSSRIISSDASLIERNTKVGARPILSTQEEEILALILDSYEERGSLMRVGWFLECVRQCFPTRGKFTRGWLRGFCLRKGFRIVAPLLRSVTDLDADTLARELNLFWRLLLFMDQQRGGYAVRVSCDEMRFSFCESRSKTLARRQYTRFGHQVRLFAPYINLLKKNRPELSVVLSFIYQPNTNKPYKAGPAMIIFRGENQLKVPVPENFSKNVLIRFNKSSYNTENLYSEFVRFISSPLPHPQLFLHDSLHMHFSQVMVNKFAELAVDVCAVPIGLTSCAQVVDQLNWFVKDHVVKKSEELAVFYSENSQIKPPGLPQMRELIVKWVMDALNQIDANERLQEKAWQHTGSSLSANSSLPEQLSNIRVFLGNTPILPQLVTPSSSLTLPQHAETIRHVFSAQAMAIVPYDASFAQQQQQRKERKPRPLVLKLVATVPPVSASSLHSETSKIDEKIKLEIEKPKSEHTNNKMEAEDVSVDDDDDDEDDDEKEKVNRFQKEEDTRGGRRESTTERDSATIRSTPLRKSTRKKTQSEEGVLSDLTNILWTKLKSRS